MGVARRYDLHLQEACVDLTSKPLLRFKDVQHIRNWSLSYKGSVLSEAAFRLSFALLCCVLMGPRLAWCRQAAWMHRLSKKQKNSAPRPQASAQGMLRSCTL